MTTTISLSQVCPVSRVSRSDGEKLRRAIESAWSDDTVVEVDFEDEVIASLGFLDEAVAALFTRHDAEVIRRRLRLIRIAEPDRRELNKLVASHRKATVGRDDGDRR